MADVALVVDIASAAHMLYADFSTHLLELLKKQVPRRKSPKDDTPPVIENPAKLRTGSSAYCAR